ncbi:WhiB family transcriptional regulator [Rhodococcus opacus]|uniref:WhiB family transcriptional regulator n=1 Tax=Rhodococcus opacus TaxID=37919 RepID=UPI002A5A8F67|nr:WhiB family transcriptional regulator [Rhodococcus opacus]
MPAPRISVHLKPLLPAWEWQLHARCRNMDTDVFFPQDEEDRGTRIRRERVAKQICSECPVRQACQNHAITP